MRRTSGIVARRRSSGGGGGSAGGPANYIWPHWDENSPWRTKIPQDSASSKTGLDWRNYVHPDSVSMCGGTDIETDYSNQNGVGDVHSWAYREDLMVQKWGSGNQILAHWFGPGGVESAVYVPATQPLITMYIDWNGSSVQWKFTSVQIPLPQSWTGYQHTGKIPGSRLERRTALYVGNGDVWLLYEVQPPGEPWMQNNAFVDNTNWHALQAEKISLTPGRGESAGGWAMKYPYWPGGGSGFPPGPGLITPLDVVYAQGNGRAGDFGHVIALNGFHTVRGTNVTSGKGAGSETHPRLAWPLPAPTGRNTDGRTDGLVGIPAGARVFLDPSISDVTLQNTYGLTQDWQFWFAHTCQRYGCYQKESQTGQGSAQNVMQEYNDSIAWNISQGIYPAGFTFPWGTDESTYNYALPIQLFPQGSSTPWKVFDWTKNYSGITAP